MTRTRCRPKDPVSSKRREVRPASSNDVQLRIALPIFKYEATSQCANFSRSFSLWL